MTPATDQATALAKPEYLGEELLRISLTDYVASLQQLPAICGTPEQQEELNRRINEGAKLIGLVNAERMKITRVIDQQKKDWIDLEKKLIAPIEKAMAPYKTAVHNYNVERVRLINQAKAEQQQVEQKLIRQNGTLDWLTPVVAEAPKPKGVREVWTYKINDASQVPYEYLSVDLAKIRAAINRGIRKIDGIEIFKEVQTQHRV